jgi:transcriptional regulator with XRE-family HTH domain
MANTPDAAGPDPIDLQVGITIRQLRKERRVSQAELGAALGITFQQIQKYERGVNRISASMLVKAALALDVQPSDLLPRTSAEPLSEDARRVAFVYGAQEVAVNFAAITSSRQRKALLTLIRVMGKAKQSSEDDETDDSDDLSS